MGTGVLGYQRNTGTWSWPEAGGNIVASLGTLAETNVALPADVPGYDDATAVYMWNNSPDQNTGLTFGATGWKHISDDGIYTGSKSKAKWFACEPSNTLPSAYKWSSWDSYSGTRYVRYWLK